MRRNAFGGTKAGASAARMPGVVEEKSVAVAAVRRTGNVAAAPERWENASQSTPRQ